MVNSTPLPPSTGPARIYDVLTLLKVVALVIAVVLLALGLAPVSAVMFIITGVLFVAAVIFRLMFDRRYGNSNFVPVLFGIALIAWGVFGL